MDLARMRVLIDGDDRGARAALDRTEKGIKAADAAMAAFDRTIEGYRREIALAGRSTAEAAARYETSRGALSNLDATLKGVVVQFARYRDAAVRAAEAQERVRAGAERLPQGMQALGRSMSVFVTAPLLAAAAAGVRSAASLEQAVASISSIKPEIDTSALFAQLNEMQTRVPQTSRELAEGVYEIFSSIETSQAGALQLVERFARGAAAAQTDAQTFGSAVMGVLNAYKLSVEDADHVSDLFFNTINKGVVRGTELAQSLGPAIASAKALGVTAEEAFAVITAATKEGGPASQNINNVANLFAKIYGEEALRGWDALGIKVTDAAGNFRPILDNVRELKTRLEALSPKDRASFLSKMLPDFQARQGLQTLISQLGLAAEQLRANRQEAGSAEAAYKKVADTTEHAAKIARNQLNKELTEQAQRLLPELTRALRVVADLLAGLSPTTKEWAVKIGLVAAALGPGVGLVGSLAKGATAVLDFIGTLRDWKKAADAAKAAQDALNLSAGGGGAAGRIAGAGLAGAGGYAGMSGLAASGLAAIPVVGVAAIARESYKDPRSVMHGGPKFGLDAPPASTQGYDALMRDLGLRPGGSGASAIAGLSPQVSSALGLASAPAMMQGLKAQVAKSEKEIAKGAADAARGVADSSKKVAGAAVRSASGVSGAVREFLEGGRRAASAAAGAWKAEIKRVLPDLGLRVRSELRTPEANRRAGGARRSHHLDGNALDIVGIRGTDRETQKRQLSHLFDWIRTNYAGKIAELFYTPKGLIKNDQWIRSAKVAATHGNHLHVALRGARGVIESMPDHLREALREFQAIEAAVAGVKEHLAERGDPNAMDLMRLVGFQGGLGLWRKAIKQRPELLGEAERLQGERGMKAVEERAFAAPARQTLEQIREAMRKAREEWRAQVQERTAAARQQLEHWTRELAMSKMTTEAERVAWEISEGRYKGVHPLMQLALRLKAREVDKANDLAAAEARASEAMRARAEFMDRHGVEPTSGGPLDGLFGSVFAVLQKQAADKSAEVTKDLQERIAGLTVGIAGLVGGVDRYAEAARAAGIEVRQLTDEQRRLIDEGARLETLKRLVEGVVEGIRGAWDGLLSSITSKGIKSFGDFFAAIRDAFVQTIAKMLQDFLASRLTQLTLDTLVSFGLPALGGAKKGTNLGKTGGVPAPQYYADGGFARAGLPAVIGELGAELVVPARDSFVLPASVTRSLARMIRGPQIAPAGATAGGGVSVSRIERLVAAGGGGKSVVVHAPVTIVAPNPGAYRNSESQMAGRLGQRIRRAMERDS